MIGTRESLGAAGRIASVMAIASEVIGECLEGIRGRGSEDC